LNLCPTVFTGKEEHPEKNQQIENFPEECGNCISVDRKLSGGVQKLYFCTAEPV